MTLRSIPLVLIWLVIPAMTVMGQTRVGQVSLAAINEQSAIVKSASYPDTYWVLNDSGDEARIFPIRKDGSVIIPPYLQNRYASGERTFPGLPVYGAVNQDWETLTRLGDTLIIGDTGNNGNARRDLALYFLVEPNPAASDGAHILSRVPVAFPDQDGWPPEEWDFDCEAIFAFGGKIYFLTKQRANQRIDMPKPATRLYRLDSRRPNRVNQLTLIGKRENLGGWVTGAEISPDETRLAVLVHHPVNSGVWIFPKPRRGDNFLKNAGQYIPIGKRGQCEGICWQDERTLLITNEAREIFSITLD